VKPRQTTPLPRVTVGVLGLVTIIAYGVAYYSYGVLVDPIKASTQGQVESDHRARVPGA
jgi:hypothetical protein